MNKSCSTHTPVILALTRRATLCGLPYNTFIMLLIGGCVALVWIDSLSIVLGLLISLYLFCRILSERDPCAIDIFFLRLQVLGVCPWPVKRYFNSRSYGAY
ncbi:MAG: VirB3 family type IV secretion system protein [Legionellales bacterium]|jgi:type IV secretory pathway VirB3-like protein